MFDLLAPDWTALPKLEVTGPAKADKHGWSIPTNVGRLALTAYAGGIFRLRLGDAEPPDYGILVAGPNTPADTELSGTKSSWVVSAQGCQLSFDNEGNLAFVRGERTLLASAPKLGDRFGTAPPTLARLGPEQWFAGLTLGSGDAVYGLGEKPGRLDRRGQLVTSWVGDPEVGNCQGSRNNCPLAWSPRGWGIFAHTPGKVTHGVGFSQWSPKIYGLLVEDGVLDLFLLAGTGGAEILQHYTVLTGRPVPPPLWSLGIWHEVNPKGGTDQTPSTLIHEMPGDILISKGSRSPSNESDGMPRSAWDLPIIDVGDPRYDELAAKEWLLQDSSTGEPYNHVSGGLGISGGLVDFTVPAACDYWREQANDRLRNGVAALAPRFAGTIADNARASNGDNGRRLNNAYPLLHSRCLLEAVKQERGGTAMAIGQAGWAGMQRFPAQQSRRADLTWEGFADALRGCLSWGLSGIPSQTMVVGGNEGASIDTNLQVRCLQAATFAGHISLTEIGSALAAASSAAPIEIVSSFLDLRYRLLPYTEGVFAEAAAAGLPAMRAMPLAFPAESECWSFDTQYMFGPDLLVAPVVTPDSRVRVFLPQGNWVDYWTDGQLSGGRRLDLTVPENRIPIFVREGAVLPFGPSVRNTGELGNRTSIERLVVYGKPIHAPCLAGNNITVLGDRLAGVPEGVVMEWINSD
ncbi:MAG: TIM-barrel domain-containing protein [Pseudomonadota bacterium]